MTTRTFILNTAINESENLRRFNLKAKESTLALQEYSTSMKLQLLINHLEESNLAEEYKAILYKKSITDFIIYHKNFYPRSVEFITSKRNVENIELPSYERFVRVNFDKPDEIWRHAYEHQINEIDRLLLNTMISFGDSVGIEKLERGFIARLDYETKYNNFKKPLHPFTKTLKRLMGGFVVHEYHQEYNSNYIKFINPSLVDFLIGYLRNERDEVIRIAESAFFLDQLVKRLYVLFESNTIYPLTPIIEERLLHQNSDFIKKDSSDRDNLIVAFILYKYYHKPDKIPHIILKLKNIDDWQFMFEDEYLIYQLNEYTRTVNESEIIDFIISKSKEIFVPILFQLDELDEFDKFLSLLESKFKIEINEIVNSVALDSLHDHITSVFNDKVIEVVDWLRDVTYDEYFVEETHRELIERRKIYETYGFKIESDFSPFFELDWEEIGNENYLREHLSKDD